MKEKSSEKLKNRRSCDNEVTSSSAMPLVVSVHLQMWRAHRNALELLPGIGTRNTVYDGNLNGDANSIKYGAASGSSALIHRRLLLRLPSNDPTTRPVIKPEPPLLRCGTVWYL